MAELHTGLTDADWFLAAIAARANLPRDVPVREAATITMCTLAERLTPGQVRHVYDALPAEIRPLFAPCLVPHGRPATKLDDADFLDLLANRLGLSPAHAELVADSVFRVMREALPPQVVDNVTVQLPGDLEDLWLGTRPPSPDAVIPYDTALWELLTDITDGVPLPVGIDASDALASVMCAFSQRLSGGEARDVFLGLPPAVRPFLEHCLLRHEEHAAVFDREALVERVAEDLGMSHRDAEHVVRVVLTAVKRMLPVKEQDDIASQLPMDLRALWEAA